MLVLLDDFIIVIYKVMRIRFNGHFGWQEKDTGAVIFYGVKFEGITWAAKYLKDVAPGPNYQGVVEGDHLYFIIKDYQHGISRMDVKRLNGLATIPRRASGGAAGYDLTSTVDIDILPGRRELVSTGISIKLPPGLYGRIAPRSGLAVKNGIQVGAGVIDPDYTGEVKVLLFNQGYDIIKIKIGERIAQLVLERFETPEIREVTEIEETERGSGGFGSTGV